VSPKRSRPMRGIDGLGLVRWWVGWGKPGCGKNCGNVISGESFLSTLSSGSDRPPSPKRASRLQYSSVTCRFQNYPWHEYLYAPRVRRTSLFPSLPHALWSTVPYCIHQGKKEKGDQLCTLSRIIHTGTTPSNLPFVNNLPPQQRYHTSRSVTKKIQRNSLFPFDNNNNMITCKLRTCIQHGFVQH